MIELTKLNDIKFMVNADIIEMVGDAGHCCDSDNR